MEGGFTSGWHLSREGATYGPYEWNDLVSWTREGRVGPDDLVWHAQLSGWMPARQIPGLIPPEAGGATQWGVPAPAAPGAGAAAWAPRGGRPKRRGLLWALLTLAGLVVIAAVVLGALYGAGVIWKGVPTVKAPMEDATVIDIPYDSAKYRVPPEGGVIQVEGAEISFPSGAVDTETMVEVKILKGQFNMTFDPSLTTGLEEGVKIVCSTGPRMDFGPSSVRFDKPVTITMPYKETLLPKGASEDTMAMAYWNGATWVAVKSAVDTNDNTVAVKRNHFAGEVWTPVYVDEATYDKLKNGPVEAEVSLSPRDADLAEPEESEDSETTTTEDWGSDESPSTTEDDGATEDGAGSEDDTMPWGTIEDADLSGQWVGTLLDTSGEETEMRIRFLQEDDGSWTVEFARDRGDPVPVDYSYGLIHFEHEGRIFEGALIDDETMSGWVMSSPDLEAPDASWYVTRAR